MEECWIEEENQHIPIEEHELKAEKHKHDNKEDILIMILPRIPPTKVQDTRKQSHSWQREMCSQLGILE